jgi:hypothetical protein
LKTEKVQEVKQRFKLPICGKAESIKTDARKSRNKTE